MILKTHRPLLKEMFFKFFSRLLSIPIILIIAIAFSKLLLLKKIDDYQFFVILGSLAILYLAFVERKIVLKRFSNRIESFNFVELLYYQKDYIGVFFIILLGLLGIISIKNNISSTFHIFFGTILLGVLLGIQVRITFNTIFYKLYLSKSISRLLIYLVLLLSATTVAIVSLTNTIYIFLLIIGFSIGVILASIRLYLKYKSFQNYFYASQDYFLVTEFPKMKEEDYLYRTTNYYLEGRELLCRIFLWINKPKDKQFESETWFRYVRLHFRLYLKLKKFDEAERDLKIIKDNFPDSFYGYYFEFLLAHFKNRDFHLEREILEKALRKFPNSPILSINYAYVLIKLQLHEEALCMLQKIIKGNYRDNPLITGMAYNNIACVLVRKTLISTNFFEILDSNHSKNNLFSYNVADYKNLLAASLCVNIASILNSNDEKIDHPKFVRTYQCREFVFNDTRAYVDFAMGNFKSALQKYDDNLRKDRMHRGTRKHLAECHAVLGNRFSARLNFAIYKVGTKYFDNEYNDSTKILKKLIGSPKGKKVKYCLDQRIEHFNQEKIVELVA